MSHRSKPILVALVTGLVFLACAGIVLHAVSAPAAPAIAGGMGPQEYDMTLTALEQAGAASTRPASGHTPGLGPAEDDQIRSALEMVPQWVVTHVAVPYTEG